MVACAVPLTKDQKVSGSNPLGRALSQRFAAVLSPLKLPRSPALRLSSVLCDERHLQRHLY